MKKWLISILIGIILGIIMFVIFIYFIKPLGHVNKTPIKNSEGIFMSSLILIGGTLCTRILMTKNNDTYSNFHNGNYFGSCGF